MLENPVLQKTLCRIVGCALLAYGSSALAFTLITPPEQTAPSNTVTDATTLAAQIQPIAAAIQAQLFSLRRLQSFRKVTQAAPVLVASAAENSRGDFDYLAAAGGDAPGTGLGGSGDTASLWISSAANSLENEFVRTSFYGATHNLVAGFDVTRSARYVLGVAVGHEASNFTTSFNVGNEKTRGFNVSPYFAYLLSDTWSVDLSAGYGEFKTRQSRSSLVAIPVDSEFASTREFVSTNLTNLSSWGNWTLTGSMGALGTRRKSDAYVESDGTPVAASRQTVKQWNLSAEAAYGRGKSETYLGLRYEKTRNPLKVRFVTGEELESDPDSVLLTAGWRYFAKDLTANFVFSKRLAQDQVNEYGFSMVIRVDL
jgi:Autotransporter beta-domain